MSTAKGLAQRALDVSLTLAATAFLLRWAYDEVRPLLPLLVFTGMVYGVLKWRRR